MSSEPVGQAYDASLPPLLGEGNDVSITITSTDVNVEVASGVEYQAWTFNNSAPGPILHMRQGQTLHVTYKNEGMMPHSLDFHSAEIDPHVAYRSINPGESLEYSFTAHVPGVFIYHCGTPPVIQHMAMGMYGAIVVDPADNSLPPADVSYVIVQSEWYTLQVKENLMTGDFDKMLGVAPDLVVFNGKAFQYKDHPLQAKAGQRVRLYFVDAGPNLTSSFHVIGEIFSEVYPGGDASQAISGVSTYLVAAGQGVVFDLVIEQPGEYVIVDHSMRSAFLGAFGLIHVAP
jgi:nitrite reductase (NO-forming)